MNAIVELQKKIGATADGSFGPQTLKLAAKYFGLTKEQTAHFFGQCSHETGEFSTFVENLNYSDQGLLKIFGKYFNPAQAKAYARNPQKIANRVYANRMGNGDEASGDGWKYKGRFAIQITGRSNYTALSKSLNDPAVLNDPDSVLDKYTFDAAKWFFDANGLWNLCKTVDDKSILAVTKRINGGTNGLDHRTQLTRKYYSWLVK